MRLGIYGRPDRRLWDPGLLWDDGLIRIWALSQPCEKNGIFFLTPNTVEYYEGPDVDHLTHVCEAFGPEYFSNAWHVRKFEGKYYAYFSECVEHDGETPNHEARIGLSDDGLKWDIKPLELKYSGYENEKGFKSELDPYVVYHADRYWLFIRVSGITWKNKPQILCGVSETPEGPWIRMQPVLSKELQDAFGETERFEVYPHEGKWRMTFSCWARYQSVINTTNNFIQYIAESDQIMGPYTLHDYHEPMPVGYGIVTERKGAKWLMASWRLKKSGVAQFVLSEHDEDPRP